MELHLTEKAVCVEKRSFFHKKKRLVLIFLLFLLLFLSHLISKLGWWQVKPLYINQDTSGNGSNFIILVWYWPFGVRDTLEGDVCMDHYHIPGCHLMDQRSLYHQANAVIFHHRELQQRLQVLPLDLLRPPHQKWTWLSLESPENSGDLSHYGNVFNWTMTYRRDADIPIPYGELIRKQAMKSSFDSIEDFITPNKSTLVCWVVSNFNDHHKRSQVYKALIKTIPVEVYGKWNNRPLANEKLLPTMSHCYFYLSFENSLSKDYITEKLWHNAYMSGAVPVVLGASLEDYKAVAPPNSFIHIDNFTSVEELGIYLRNLSQNQQEYASYQAWRRDYKVKRLASWVERFCRICLYHHNLSAQTVYPDLEAWVRG
ncbi:alpha-(1,3)-fucosyltransferase 7 [Hypomesus transpacificus]|uniref:alpha-(1,3)-fucosyltransferase 7 n=1 Tax=Hypomesus transpacificus TaxID=137520 RepID=UPI001F087AE9|nr:alpha-(1,3)-fucosyltransferase 7 [Hypomesus transpacificus]